MIEFHISWMLFSFSRIGLFTPQIAVFLALIYRVLCPNLPIRLLREVRAMPVSWQP